MTDPLTHKPSRAATALRIILPVLILAGGVMIARYLYATKPVAERRRPVPQIPLVETITAESMNHQVTIDTMGTVMASRAITLKPRVSGTVIETAGAFVPGGLFTKGEVILRLDPKDYVLALNKKKIELEKAEADLALEMGRQEVAREEVRLLQSTLNQPVGNSDLALRKPQLAQVKADIASVRTDIELAALDLERTLIQAPFNCMVLEKYVEPGSQVSVQEALADIVATDEYWVEATVPMDRLQWIDIPRTADGTGSPAVVTSQAGTRYPGRVIRLLGSLNADSRMARVLVAVSDPLSLVSGDRVPLLLDSYVNISIQGRTIKDAIAVPRKALQENDTVWVEEDGKLRIRPVAIAWKGTDRLFISHGIKPGDAVIVSELSMAVENMAVATETGDTATPAGRPQGKGKQP